MDQRKLKQQCEDMRFVEAELRRDLQPYQRQLLSQLKHTLERWYDALRERDEREMRNPTDFDLDYLIRRLDELNVGLNLSPLRYELDEEERQTIKDARACLKTLRTLFVKDGS